MIGIETLTVVMGQRVIEVVLEIDDRPRSLGLVVRVDGAERWSSEEPGWRDLGCGAGDDFFVWSARRLVVVPMEPDAGTAVVDSDEDIVIVFPVEGAWLLVCEASLRLIVDGVESGRLELPDVVQAARWVGGRLAVTMHEAGVVEVDVSAGGLLSSDCS